MPHLNTREMEIALIKYLKLADASACCILIVMLLDGDSRMRRIGKLIWSVDLSSFVPLAVFASQIPRLNACCFGVAGLMLPIPSWMPTFSTL